MRILLFFFLFGAAAAAPHIVGGKPIEISEAPYQLELDWDVGGWIFQCGASIVGPTTVITAGHCVEGLTAHQIRVRSGATERGHGDIHNAKTVVQHPDYYVSSDFVPHNDIAIIEVDTPFQFNENAQPVEITTTEPKEGKVAFISGWGALREGGSGPTQLYGVEIPIVDKKECNQDYDGVIEENMICAGIPEGGKDSCQGDSGGPVVIDGKLVGIVSWGYGCAEPGKLGVYTNVAYFKNWIDQQKISFAKH